MTKENHCGMEKRKKKKEKKLTTNTENDFVVFNAQCLMYNISHTYCVVLIRNNKKSEKTTPTTKKKKRINISIE